MYPNAHCSISAFVVPAPSAPDPEYARSREVSTLLACSNWCKASANEARKSGHQAVWLWFGSLPLSWLFGIPFFGVFVPLAVSLPAIVAMLVVLAGMGLAARSALNY